ncbi:hypothetical protein CTI12_AA093680 [Artemisia annua]|uniref:Uncharacterized protein n=1 Tax=Artemisia annua TaxID=35608 RepID=A0A2U1PZK6_ARTAN|nr:hypothetical protein CTI12_AA093680 [Artemisia annua]
MEIVTSAFDGSLKRTWRRRRYRRFNNSHKKGSTTVMLGGRRSRRFWRIKAIPRLRLKTLSPFRLLINLKNVYVKMMLRLAGSDYFFGSKNGPKALHSYSTEEYHKRLLYEMSKGVFASRELASA